MITERSTPEPGRTRSGRRIVAAVSLAALAAGVMDVATAGVASAATPTVLVATNAQFGTILTTGDGMALYTLDTDHNGQSTCHGSCAAVWPPLNVPAGTAATGGPGVTGTVGTATQSNGTVQVTYNGAPLYTFVSDSSPGQVTGNNVSGFFVVTVTPATTTTTAPANGAPVTSPGTGSSPPAGSPTGPSASPAPTAASGPTSATAPSSGSAPGVTSSAPGALAFTGPGPGLRWLTLMGLVLMMLGALLLLGAGRRRGSGPALSE